MGSRMGPTSASASEGDAEGSGGTAEGAAARATYAAPEGGALAAAGLAGGRDDLPLFLHKAVAAWGGIFRPGGPAASCSGGDFRDDAAAPPVAAAGRLAAGGGLDAAAGDPRGDPFGDPRGRAAALIALLALPVLLGEGGFLAAATTPAIAGSCPEGLPRFPGAVNCGGGFGCGGLCLCT